MGAIKEVGADVTARDGDWVGPEVASVPSVFLPDIKEVGADVTAGDGDWVGAEVASVPSVFLPDIKEVGADVTTPVPSVLFLPADTFVLPSQAR